MTEPPETQRVRLQKFLSDAGVASRRRCEELILEGRVLVNDQVVDQLPAFVDPQRDVVVTDGDRVRPRLLEYLLLHKPKGVVCTNRDPAGRTRVRDLLPPDKRHLFTVGRLDADSTGLLLLTNDGELAARLTHPRFGVAKVYLAEVRGLVRPDLPQRMRAGVYLAEGRARAADVRILHRARDRCALQITLREGRNRQVRRMLARLGHPVRKLKRIAIGPLRLTGLPIGALRPLTQPEIRALRAAVAHAAAEPIGSHRSGRRRAAARASETSLASSPREGRGKQGTRRRVID
jgi:23S rRNA pseudouridine2605 synthase